MDYLLLKDGVDIPEAVQYDAEVMYNKLLEEKEKNQEQQDSQEGGQSSQQEQGEGQQGEEKNQADSNVGHDTHDLWEKAIEERKKEQSSQDSQESKEGQDSEGKTAKQKKEGKEHKEEKQVTSGDKKEKQDKNDIKQESEFSKKGEQETFKQNKIERKKRLQELSKELANKSSHEAGTEIQREGKKIFDIGIATPLIDWRKLLRQAVKYDEEWTRKNARMRNGYFRHKVVQIPIPETEILLDTSGSVSEILLKNFLRECKNILDNSKVKVGCFNTEFHGFTELKRPEDIDKMDFPIGGGTDFNVAVKAFSRRAQNKIIFTDGEANMPKDVVRNVIWVVFGDTKINPKGGKVIYITEEQLRKLYQNYMKDNTNERVASL